MISDDLYVKAKVPPSGKVGLWLGVTNNFLLINLYLRK